VPDLVATGLKKVIGIPEFYHLNAEKNNFPDSTDL